jgi:hypothetical protein
MDFSGAAGLEKGQGHGAQFTNFETRPMRQSGPPGSQGRTVGAHHDFSIAGRVVLANFDLRPLFASNFMPLP